MSIFNSLGGGNLPGIFGNMQQMAQAFNQFKNTFQGDPQQKVQELLQSGRINQAQLNQFQQMAQQLAPQLQQFFN